MVALAAMTDLALIAVGVGVGLLIAVKLVVFVAISAARIFMSWIHRAL